jgi:hypothetical protein
MTSIHCILSTPVVAIKDNHHQHTFVACSIVANKDKYYQLQEDGILMYRGKIYMQNFSDMTNIVLMEM